MMQRHLQVVEESQRLTELLNRYLRFMCADAKRPHSRAVLLCVTLDCGPQNCDWCVHWVWKRRKRREWGSWERGGKSIPALGGQVFSRPLHGAAEWRCNERVFLLLNLYWCEQSFPCCPWRRVELHRFVAVYQPLPAEVAEALGHCCVRTGEEDPNRSLGQTDGQSELIQAQSRQPDSKPLQE